MKSIYLAGPMDYATTSQQRDWRQKVISLFHTWDVNLLDPTRRPHSCGLTAKEIFELDIVDINNADLLLTDARQLNIPVFGTPCEVFYASYILRKPVIAWYDEEHKPTKKRVFQEVLYTRELPSLEDAVDHIKAFYL